MINNHGNSKYPDNLNGYCHESSIQVNARITLPVVFVDGLGSGSPGPSAGSANGGLQNYPYNRHKSEFLENVSNKMTR